MSMKGVAHLLLLALALPFAAGCRTRPTAAYFPGHWVLQDDGSGHPSPAEAAAAQLQLNPDGTFVATALPCLMMYDEKPDGTCAGSGPLSGTGIWRFAPAGSTDSLGSVAAYDNVTLTFRTHNGTTGPTPFLEFPLRIGGFRKLYLYALKGDPDAGRAYEFDRSGS